MAKDNKKKVEQITDMEVDFAQWYTDVCKKAELIDYSSIKGMFIYRPYGYAIWENIQAELDKRFKETGPRERLPAHADPRVPAAEGEGPRGGLRPRVRLGDHGRQRRSWKSATASAPPARRCSASIIRTSSSPTGTCPSCTTSGAPCCAGRRPAAPSCVTGSSCGRRATPCTPPPRRPAPRPSRC